MSKQKILFILIFYFLFIMIKSSNNYLSIEVIKADDCIRWVKINNVELFTFTKNGNGTCEWGSFGDCDANDYNHVYPYPADKIILRDYKYEYGVKVKVRLEDYNHIESYLNVNVYFNEYKIKTSDNSGLWKCEDCGVYKNENYFFYNSNMNSYPQGRGDGKCTPNYYLFVFSIDNIEQLYKGGFETISNFYSFTSEAIFYRNISYLENELELINFNTTENFHMTNKANLSVEITNYEFKIEFANQFGGTLKALSVSNSNKENLNTGDLFKVTNELGLNYELSAEEKENRYAKIVVKITAYNKCPNINGYQCTSKVVAEEKLFTFIINVFGWPLTTIPTTEYIPPTTEYIPPTTEYILPTTEYIPPTTEYIPPTTEYNSPITEYFPSKSEYIPPIIESILSNSDYSHCLNKSISFDPIKNISTHICPDYNLDKIMINIDDILPRIDNNTRYVIIAKDYVTHIIPIDYSDTNENTEIFYPSSYVNFSECEKILRDYYHIYSPRKITFIQIELNNTNNEILVNQLEYQAYDDEYTKLNLSLCNNTYIETYYSFKNDTEEKVDLINYYKKLDIDILDINDNFFNDVCYPFSDSDDLTLTNRRQNIYKNYTLCETNCQLNEIFVEQKMIVCNCTVKENINTTLLNFNFSEPISQIKNDQYWIFDFLFINDNKYCSFNFILFKLKKHKILYK